MKRPAIHVVIVNWNSGDQLGQCLQSFASVAADAVDIAGVTIVDNASVDGSLDAMARLQSTLPLIVIRNPGNRGFAAACNQGASGAGAELLLFLNPDTRLMPASLETPARFLCDPVNRAVGIVGIQLVDAAGNVARNCARRPRPLTMVGNVLGLDRLLPKLFPPHFLVEWDHAQTRRVDQVMGAFWLIRRTLFERLGGFDERFFVYYEDLDLAVQAHELGWDSVYLASARAFHRSGGTTESIRGRRLFYFTRSRILYALKHFTPVAATAVIVASLLGEPVARTLHALVARRPADVGDIARGFALLWRDLPSVIQTHLRLANAERPRPHAL
jgi:N-acetylglucosaminyl-diphospho-decaprenol L-rhamnosyltransferase